MEAAFMDSGTTVDKVSFGSVFCSAAIMAVIAIIRRNLTLCAVFPFLSSNIAPTTGRERPTLVFHRCHRHRRPRQDDTRSEGYGQDTAANFGTRPERERNERRRNDTEVDQPRQRRREGPGGHR